MPCRVRIFARNNSVAAVGRPHLHLSCARRMCAIYAFRARATSPGERAFTIPIGAPIRLPGIVFNMNFPSTRTCAPAAAAAAHAASFAGTRVRARAPSTFRAQYLFADVCRKANKPPPTTSTPSMCRCGCTAQVLLNVIRVCVCLALPPVPIPIV